jgi:hypothetical protein
MTKPDNTGRKQAGRFAKGKSGNPEGRPRGTRNSTTVALESLLDGQAQALTQKAIELALTGDLTALRICLDRIMPPRKDRHVPFAFPKIAKAADAVTAAAAIVEAVAAGDLTPSEASELTRVLESYSRILEAADHEERLKRLEANLQGRL